MQEFEYYSVLEISKALNLTPSAIRLKIKRFCIESDVKQKCRISGISSKHYSQKQFLALSNQYEYFEIPKKERKPYFEFATITLESKMNEL